MSSSRPKRKKVRTKREPRARQAIQQPSDKRFSKALVFHRNGQLQQAQILYKRILNDHPTHADVRHLLGVISHQTGNYSESVELIRQAIAQNPAVASYHTNLGLSLRELGQLDEAKACHETALSLNPEYADAYNNLGIILQQLNASDDALTAYRRALELRPDHPDAYTNLGITLAELGQLEEALTACQNAVRLKPGGPEMHHNLGNILHQLGDEEAAIAAYRTALQLRPDYTNTHISLGSVLQVQGHLDDAMELYEAALRVNSNFAEAYNNIGTVYKSRGDLEAARTAYQTAIQLKPELAEAYNNLATLEQSCGDWNTAKQHYETALSYQPNSPGVHYNLGNLLQLLGDHEAALAAYERAVQLKPDSVDAWISIGTIALEQGRLTDAVAYFAYIMQLEPMDGLRIRLSTLLPPIYASTEDLYTHRLHLINGLTQLASLPLIINNPIRESGTTMFYLAYQGLNDRNIQQLVAELYRKAYADAHQVSRIRPPHRAKPIIGFISCYFQHHTIGKLTRGLIEQLSRDQFEVVVFSVAPRQDPMAQRIQDSADRYIMLPSDLLIMRETLQQNPVDILFYPDIGMNPYTYFLAMTRFAPIQCVSWGHPVTTGLETIDYFISSSDLEPDDADDYYTETLVRLSTLPTYYYHPVWPESLQSRAAFGLSEQERLYLCPQSLFKFHPDFDAILASILRTDPHGRIVLIKGAHPHWTSLLLERFHNSMPEVVDRVIFLPRQPEPAFLNLMALSDILLDPIHFGGGNTSYEAFSMGLPIVTYPGAFMRSRVTYACYKKMGVMDCVASSPEEYVYLAVKLATDLDYRATVRASLLANNHVLYEDIGVVQEFEQFFQRALAAIDT